MSEPKCLIMGGLACAMCIAVLVMIIILGGAGTIEPVEYGIIYSKFDKSIDVGEGVKTGGWYFIGWTKNFFTFPATQVNMDFTTFRGSQRSPIKVYDKNGQQITVSFSLQYKLRKDDIITLYNKYQLTYERKYESFIKQAITAEVGNFMNTVFWTDRKMAGKNLKAAVTKVLSTQYCDVVGFQILSIDLLRSRENTLIKTQVIRQQASTNDKLKQSKEIRAGISFKKAEAEKQMKVIVGNADAAAKTKVGVAQATATNDIIEATSTAYAQLQTKVGVGPTTGLSEFIYYSQLQNTDDTDFVFNIKNAFIKVNN